MESQKNKTTKNISNTTLMAAIFLLAATFAFVGPADAASALSFYGDGDGDYVSTGLYINQRVKQSYTFEAWVYPDKFSSGYDQVMSTDNGGYDWSLLRYKNKWYVFNGFGSHDTGFSVDNEKWQHVAMTIIPGTGVKFYKNGEESFITKDIEYDYSANDLSIGRNPGYEEYFNGIIDEVRVWKCALSRSTIQTWKDKHLAVWHPNYGDLMAHYPFDEGTGQVANDHNGAYDGSIHGAAWTASSAPIASAPFPYYEDFSHVNSSVGWSFYKSTNHGRIEIQNGRLRMDSAVDNSNVLNEAVLTLDLAGQSDVFLEFFHQSYGDELERLPAIFSGHRDGDGVAISDDGSNWYTVVTADALGETASGTFTVSLDDAISVIRQNHGSAFGYNDSFKIKFQQYDDYPYATDGREWDNILVYTDVSDLVSNDRPIAAGSHFSLGLKPDGTVWAWGSDEKGMLGDGPPSGTDVKKNVPVQVSNLTDVVSVANGSYHGLALKSDGTVWAWGGNSSGQLGDGTTVDKDEPVQVKNLSNVVAIAAAGGGSHSLALTSDGAVWAWGFNSRGQLGGGSSVGINQQTPVQVKNLSNVVAIAAGSSHSLALKRNGTVWAWGINSSFELGDGTKTNRNTPVQVKNLLDVVAIAANRHSLALKRDGAVWAWGRNKRGELGYGTTTNSPMPVRVKNLSNVASIAAGLNLSLASTSDGAAWAWGRSSHGKLGNFSWDGKDALEPVQVIKSSTEPISDVASISAGNDHSLAMTSNGDIFAWGSNLYGQLGDGGYNTYYPWPVQTVFGTVAMNTPEIPDAAAGPGAAGHLLYAMSLAPEFADATLESVAFKTNGDYMTSDINEFQLRFSADETLDEADPTLAASASIGAGNTLTFSGFSQSIANGGEAYLFLTANIAAGAGGARTIFISTPAPGFVQSFAVTGTPAPGGVQTFESAVVSITPHALSSTTAVQAASGHALYALKLSVGDNMDAVLTDFAAVTGGQYVESDISGFSLRFSQDPVLDPDDPELATHAVAASGGTLSFSGFSQVLPAGSVGYLFITADMADAVATGGTVSIKAVDFDDIGFAVDPTKVGTNPAAASPVHDIYAYPVISVTTPAVAAAEVAQGTENHTLYKMDLTASDNDAVLKALTLIPRGTYAPSDIARFRLYASDDPDWDPGDAALAESTASPSPGQPLTFSGLSLAIAKGQTRRLIVTADVHEDAEGARTIYMDPLSFNHLTFDPAGTVITEGAALLAGGVQTFPISPYTAMSAGFYHTIALKQNGTVWAWGNNENGQIGDGTTDNSDIALPVAGLTGVVDTVAGDYFSIALKDDGTVWAWGQNDFGQLGDGTLDDQPLPVRVSGLTDAVMVAAGDAHCAALMADGSVKTWGGNRYGQLGDGTTNDSRTPLRVSGLTEIVAVAAGGGRTLALDANGKVWAWGQNDFGQLGDGATTNRTSPVQVAGLPSIDAIAAGDFHSLALDDDGNVWAWGNNENGQLGDGTTTDRSTPVKVSGLSGVSAIAAGNRHSLALLPPPAKTVWAWGWNEHGQLGDGTNEDRPTPVQVPNDASGAGNTYQSDVEKIAAGGDFSLALDVGGKIWAWGHNEFSQLGDGTADNRNAPVRGGIIPLIKITAPAVVEDVAVRGAVDYVLYRLKFEVTDADATLTDLEPTTGGDYETSDLAGEFRLYVSEDDVLDADDPLLATQGLAPPGGALRFSGMEQPILKGTTRYLFVTVDLAADPVAERNIFINDLSFENIGFAERNVFKSGDDPLPAGGAQVFPVLTVAVEAPAVADADLSQNAEAQILYRLNLRVTDGPAGENATLSRLTLTPTGDYRLSDIVGNGFKLRHSVDDVLDPGDSTIGVSGPVEPGDRLTFEGMNQPVLTAGSHLFVTADVSASAGGGRTLAIDETRFPDIGFAETFVSKTGTDPIAAGGTMTFPISVIQATATAAETVVEQSAANHALYRIDLTVSNADAKLAGLTLTPGGDYADSDIQGFRLFYSEDDVLTPDADPLLAERPTVSTGTPLVFDGLSRMLRQGTGHLFLTADIGDFAVGRTIFVTQTPLENLALADDVRFQPADATALAHGGVQTFPTPQVAIASPAVPAVTVEQDTANHPVYRVDLAVSDARAVLNQIGFVTAGTYFASDIDRFTLRLSEDEVLDDTDASMGTLDPATPGQDLVFSDLSLTIEKGTAAHLFLAVDVGEANGGRTVNIAATPFDQLDFREPDVMTVSGTDPLAEGAATTFPVPAIAVTAPEVPAATIEQEVSDLILYQVNLEIARAEAVLQRATFVTAGTYIPKDLAAETPFKLRFSQDDFLDENDALLGAAAFANPGEVLDFAGLSQAIPKGTTGRLFVTVDVDRANGARTLFIDGVALSRLTFEFGDKTGTDPLAAGGVQTFPVPAITIAALNVPASDDTGQFTPNLVLCGFSLSIERAEAVLQQLTLKTAGTYLASDLTDETPFKLWHSTNDAFTTGDSELAAAAFVGSGGDLVFDEMSRMIDKTTTGYLFVTVDVGEAVGRHIFIDATAFDNLVFEFGDKLGTNPVAAFSPHQFPIPNVAIASSAVAPATVEPRTTDHLLYRLTLDPTKAEAMFTSLNIRMAGTYRQSEIRTDCAGMNPCTPEVEKTLPVFKLWHSDDDALDTLEGAGDVVLADSLYAASGQTVTFDGFNQVIGKNKTGHFFLTANIGPAAPDRTVYVEPVTFNAIGLSYREKTAVDPAVIQTGTDPLTAGGVQTIAQTPGSLLSMDGVEDFLEAPFDADLNPDAFTVSFQASVAAQQDADGNTVRTRQAIVASVDEDNFAGYEFFVDTDNKLKFRIGTGTGWQIVEGPEVVDNRFYDVSGVYNGTSAVFYVNGQSFGQVATGFSANASAPLRIGTQPDGDNDLNGQISEIHIWNIARTQEEIAAGIETPPTDDESGIVAHYRFIPWGTLVDTTGHENDGTINGDPAWVSALSGLWVGQIEINGVNELGFGSLDTETPREAPNPFDLRILLHVDAKDAVRLVRHVTLMQKRYTVEDADGNPVEMARRYLITDDDRLYDYEGVVRRDGKMTGVRLSSLAFDFDPELDELPLDGKIRAGAALSGDVTLAADHPRNPFRHRFHPDHRSGRDIHRTFSLTINPDVDLQQPTAGAFELEGDYEETIEGLHKLPIRMKGTFQLERVSVIPELNDGE